MTASLLFVNFPQITKIKIHSDPKIKAFFINQFILIEESKLRQEKSS